MGMIVYIIVGVFVLIAIGIAIAFLLNLQNTLKAAAPENRKLPPVNVWLLLIPYFNNIYFFIVTKRISETIEAEYHSKGHVPETPQPTYKVGMAFSILNLISTLISLSYINYTIASYSATLSGDINRIMNVANQPLVAWCLLSVLFWG
jgi:hypothetical protein